MLIECTASGMGFAAVKLFLKEGAKVVALDLNERNLNQLSELNNPDILPTKLDVTDEDGWKRVAVLTVEKFGEIDILVNNASLQ